MTLMSWLGRKVSTQTNKQNIRLGTKLYKQIASIQRGTNRTSRPYCKLVSILLRKRLYVDRYYWSIQFNFLIFRCHLILIMIIPSLNLQLRSFKTKVSVPKTALNLFYHCDYFAGEEKTDWLICFLLILVFDLFMSWFVWPSSCSSVGYDLWLCLFLLLLLFWIYITKPCLYNYHPLKPHFYIVKLGFAGVYFIFFLFLFET